MFSSILNFFGQDLCKHPGHRLLAFFLLSLCRIMFLFDFLLSPGFLSPPAMVCVDRVCDGYGWLLSIYICTTPASTRMVYAHIINYFFINISIHQNIFILTHTISHFLYQIRLETTRLIFSIKSRDKIKVYGK